MQSREATIFSGSVSEILSKTCSPMQKSCAGDHYEVPIFILFIRFHNPKEPHREEENEKSVLISASSPALFKTSFYFAVTPFLNYFYLLTYLDDTFPTLRSLELAPRQATSHGPEQSAKPMSTTTSRRRMTHTG